MKAEFPAFQSKVCTILAIPIIGISVSFFNYFAVFKPSENVYTLAITFFGVTAGLSGLCFAMSPTKTGEPLIRLAGEKFLHSSVLLLQTLIVLFAKNSLLGLSIVNDHKIIKAIIIMLFTFIVFIVSTMAAVTWFHGFQKLNRELWERYRVRIENIRESKEKKA
jgi:hypothetical protein